jgi:Protein of unknown function (DUF3153)
VKNFWAHRSGILASGKTIIDGRSTEQSKISYTEKRSPTRHRRSAFVLSPMPFPPRSVKHFVTNCWQFCQSRFSQGRSLVLLLLISLTLTGCVEAKTSIHFDNPQHGTLTQHIKLGSQLTTAQGWLNQLERQARRLGGKVDRSSRQELDLEIPFNGAWDLTQKFNQLFNTAAQPGSNVPSIASNFRVSTSNLLLFDRHRINYDLDLSALGIQDENGQVLLNAGSALDLSFGVSGPWGREIVQTLQPGKNNHLQAAFWMPNPLGWGAAMIAGIVAAGTYYSRQTR